MEPPRLYPPGGRAAFASVTLTLLLQLVPLALARMERELGPRTVAELTAAAGPDARLRADLTGADRPENRPDLRRVPLPDPWREAGGKRRAPESLLAFVDGQAIPFSYREPLQWPADRGPTLAYYLSPRRANLIVRCGPLSHCAELFVVRDSLWLRVELLQRRLRSSPRWALALLGLPILCVALGAAGAWAWRLPDWAFPAIGAALVATWFGAGLDANPEATTWFLLEAVALAIPLLLRPLRAAAVALWQASQAEQPSTRRALAGLALVTAPAFVAALPRLWFGRSWSPSDQDDSFLYLFASSRFLSTGSLLEGLSRPGAWVYSAYPALVATIAGLTGAHPMRLYLRAADLGAVMLPLCLGLLAWVYSKRVSVAMAACWIAGAWGGLAGHAWLVTEALPALLSGRSPPLVETDYYTPDFFGEYAGPHSEITAYLCDPPFYPREVGVALFWLALVVALKGRGAQVLLGVTALGVSSFAVYPYVGLSVLILFAACVPAPPLRKGGWPLGGAVVAAAGLLTLGMLGLSDLFIRNYLEPAGLGAYLFGLWSGASTPPASPPYDFRLSRVLSGHFFILGTVGLGAWLTRTTTNERVQLRGLARTLTLLGLVLALVSGVAAGLEPRFWRLFSLQRWIVPWRTLVEPFLVVLGALALERCLRFLWHEGWRAAAVAMLLLPCVSPLHWTFNSWRYRGTARGSGLEDRRALYDEFAGYGTQVLGRLRLREPLLVESAPLVLGDYAQAAFGVTTVNNVRAMTSGARPNPLLEPAAETRLRAASERGDVGDVMLLSGSEPWRRLSSTSAWAELTTLGRFVVLRPTAVEAARQSRR